MDDKKWELLHKAKIKWSDAQEIIDALLKNRGIKTKKEKKEFFEPTPPFSISLKQVGISITQVNQAIRRIRKAKKDGEKVVVFGDYDADGICATVILTESLKSLGLNVLPYIPDRFEEGYGLKVESLEKIIKNPPASPSEAGRANVKLIITVDNGIVANEAVDRANELGIDVIITDHHLPRTKRGQKGKKLPKAHSIIHSTQIGGAGIAWVLAREINKKLQNPSEPVAKTPKSQTSLDLAAIGTIADQLPLIGVNRAFAKYGLEELNITKRPGLLALFKTARIKAGEIKTYDINFVIAPRLNAMGRLAHAMESFGLLYKKDQDEAKDLAMRLSKTNYERQKIVEKVVVHAKKAAGEEMASGPEGKGVIVIHHESYHEGVIGLAASKLVDTFYRPAIVFSKGERYSKASARSIPGFNIIDAIRNFDKMLVDGGGHPMAAGFTIKTSSLLEFSRKLTQFSAPLLTKKILQKKQKIDLELDFSQINRQLVKEILLLEPFGIGNYAPVFATYGISVLNARTVGITGRHLKLTLEQGDKVFDAIAFNLGDFYLKLTPGGLIDLAYNIEENTWQGRTNLQLKVKDIKLA